MAISSYCSLNSLSPPTTSPSSSIPTTPQVSWWVNSTELITICLTLNYPLTDRILQLANYKGTIMEESMFIGFNMRGDRARRRRYRGGGRSRKSYGDGYATSIDDHRQGSEMERQKGLLTVAAELSWNHRAGEPSAAVGAAAMGGHWLRWDGAAR